MKSFVVRSIRVILENLDPNGLNSLVQLETQFGLFGFLFQKMGLIQPSNKEKG